MTESYADIGRRIRNGEFKAEEAQYILREAHRFVATQNAVKAQSKLQGTRTIPIYSRVTLSDGTRPKCIASATGLFIRGVGRENYYSGFPSALILLDDNPAYEKYSGAFIRVAPAALKLTERINTI